MTLAEQRRLLRLPVPDAARGGLEEEAEAAGSLAVELAKRLGCAVLAMRFPVVDEFAIGLAERVYRLVAEMGQPVARAVGIALGDPGVVADPPTLSCPALSLVTPALFGAAAVDLTLQAPERPQPTGFDPRMLRLAGFPSVPERFVGRTVVMAWASAALAPRSKMPGVLLHGMPGGGKTACALELAYTHEHAFEALIWFKAPDQGLDIADALTRFALTLENQLTGLQLVHLLDDQAKLAGFLPQLTELLERTRILIIVDNIESLLTDQGSWRDARWAPVIAALTDHEGLGRVVLTSRRLPAQLDSRVRVLAVDALSADETLLLARELRHLWALIDGQVAGIGTQTARQLAVGVLEVAQGHPKLLELADGQAARPRQLQNLLDTAGEAWQQAGGLPEGFFATGETAAGEEDFLQVLAAWTAVAANQLAPAARDLFCFLCCLEESDRGWAVLEANWARLRERLGRLGDPPSLDENLAAVAAVGLAAITPATQRAADEYGIHPGVAAAGRDLAGDAFRQAADTELAAVWAGVAQMAKEREAEEQTSGMVVRAGLSAAPYLLRLGAWKQARDMLGDVLTRDWSQVAAEAALPALRTIATALQGTESEPVAVGVLAMALERIDPEAAGRQREQLLAAAVARDDYAIASVVATHLSDYRRKVGRLSEALNLSEDAIRYDQLAGFGPWTQLGDEARRLYILNEMGQYGQVLAEVRRLREHMSTLPTSSSQLEARSPWDARESLLNAGLLAAVRLGRWQEALELNGAETASMAARGAPQDAIARIRFNDYSPLLMLDRPDEAVELLRECRQVFEAAHDIQSLGGVLVALGEIEAMRRHNDVAIGLQRDALRYAYVAQDMNTILIGHHNLGDYLFHDGQPGDALAHHLAAALLRKVTGTSELDQSVTGAAQDLRAGSHRTVPADVAELCRRVGEVSGVLLDQLLTGLTDPQSAENALQQLIAQARTEAAALAPAANTARWLAAWDPVIAGLAAASQGDTQAGAAVRKHLASHRDSEDWAALAQVLQRVQDGDRGQDLTAEMDPIGTAIVVRALDVLAGQADVPAALWPAMGLGTFLGDIVAAADGDGDEATAWRARQNLAALAAVPELADLATALGRVLDGDRDPGLPGTLSGDTERAVVATVLAHIATTLHQKPGEENGT
jgi:tetratricopeptide (TPR) repeat protein